MDALDYRILSLLRFGPRSFEEILEETWGISPADLDRAIKDLLADRVLVQRGDEYELNDSRSKSLSPTSSVDINKRKLSLTDKKVASFLSSLPVPHPHDFDWRFSIPGIRAFVTHILKYHKINHSICVISAPTVYAYLRTLNIFPSLSLVERSEDTVECIRHYFGDASGVCSHDLQYPWPARFIGEFDCIIMDPPWYQDYYELFLLRATEILASGGLIHTAIFPPFAKTHALVERSAIFSFAHNRGLHLIELRAGTLEYDSPEFERKAFSVEGFEPKRNWRRGDIATFFLGFKYGREHVFQVETGKWQEFRIGKSKLKIRIEEIMGYEPPSIQTVEDNSPYLSSVSRKYDRRDEIGLWTSYQQAFKIKGSSVISLMIECLLDGKSKGAILQEIAYKFDMPLETVEEDCSTCVDILAEIIKREREVQSHDLE